MAQRTQRRQRAQRHSSLTAVAQFCRCRRKVLSLPPHSSPTAVAMQCQTSSKVLPPQRQNFAPAVRELCHGSRRTVRLVSNTEKITWYDLTAVAVFKKRKNKRKKSHGKKTIDFFLLFFQARKTVNSSEC